MKKVRVILADDHTVMRMGVRNLLSRSMQIEVIGEAGTGDEALQLVEELKPDVLVLDMEMPGKDGVEVARELHSLNSPVNILVLSAYNDKHYIQSVLDQGASGYLTKDEAPDRIVDAVLQVAKGERGYFSRKVTARLSETDKPED